MLIHVNFQPNPYSKSLPQFSVEELALIFLGGGGGGGGGGVGLNSFQELALIFS